jgi:hypothetical protein
MICFILLTIELAEETEDRVAYAGLSRFSQESASAFCRTTTNRLRIFRRRDPKHSFLYLSFARFLLKLHNKHKNESYYPHLNSYRANLRGLGLRRDELPEDTKP